MSNPFPVDINPAVQHVPLTTPRDYTRAIVREIAEAHGVDPKSIFARDRRPLVIKAKRAAIIAVIKAKPHLSFPDLGRIFGLDHTTLVHHAQVAGLPPRPARPTLFGNAPTNQQAAE